MEDETARLYVPARRDALDGGRSARRQAANRTPPIRNGTDREVAGPGDHHRGAEYTDSVRQVRTQRGVEPCPPFSPTISTNARIVGNQTITCSELAKIH